MGYKKNPALAGFNYLLYLFTLDLFSIFSITYLSS